MASTTKSQTARRGTRTNIVLDDELLEDARRLTGIATKRELVNEALRLLVQVRQQEAALKALRGSVKWEGDLQEMRRGFLRYGDR